MERHNNAVAHLNCRDLWTDGLDDSDAAVAHDDGRGVELEIAGAQGYARHKHRSTLV